MRGAWAKECMNTLSLANAGLSYAGFTIMNVLIVGRRKRSDFNQQQRKAKTSDSL